MTQVIGTVPRVSRHGDRPSIVYSGCGVEPPDRAITRAPVRTRSTIVRAAPRSRSSLDSKTRKFITVLKAEGRGQKWLSSAFGLHFCLLPSDPLSPFTLPTPG